MWAAGKVRQGYTFYHERNEPQRSLPHIYIYMCVYPFSLHTPQTLHAWRLPPNYPSHRPIRPACRQDAPLGRIYPLFTRAGLDVACPRPQHSSRSRVVMRRVERGPPGLDGRTSKVETVGMCWSLEIWDVMLKRSESIWSVLWSGVNLRHLEPITWSFSWADLHHFSQAPLAFPPSRLPSVRSRPPVPPPDRPRPRPDGSDRLNRPRCDLQRRRVPRAPLEGTDGTTVEISVFGNVWSFWVDRRWEWRPRRHGHVLFGEYSIFWCVLLFTWNQMKLTWNIESCTWLDKHWQPVELMFHLSWTSEVETCFNVVNWCSKSRGELLLFITYDCVLMGKNIW